MFPRQLSPLRWLRTVVALLTLFGPAGVHAMLHWESWSLDVSSVEHGDQLEIHDENCPHRQGLREPHSHACLFVKCAHAHDVVVPDVCATAVRDESFRRVAGDATYHAAFGAYPRVHGARGPPLTTA